jgi:hypothetical protein
LIPKEDCPQMTQMTQIRADEEDPDPICVNQRDLRAMEAGR